MKKNFASSTGLYGIVPMSAAERTTGRFMRAPDGHENQQETQNNAGGASEGNSASGGNGVSDSNNNGQEFDPRAFWNGPTREGGAAPSGESAGSDSSGSDTEDGDTSNFGQQLTQQLENLNFGATIFDNEIAEQINSGDFTGVHQRLNQMGQQIVRQSLALQLQVLRPLADQILQQVRNETNQTFNERDNNESLVRLFPAAKNPAMERTIRPIYEQALRNANGNREAAVAMTKDMLRYMAGESAQDLDLEVAPRGSNDRGGPSRPINWLDELSAR